jgi:hypothetical protein
MFNLFGRLTEQAFELDAILQELEGDISDQVIQDWITRNEKNEKDLINAACGVIQEYDQYETLYDEELKRLQERKVSYTKKKDAIKKQIIEYQKKIGKKVIDTGLFRTSVNGNGGLAPLEVNEEFIKNPKLIPFTKEKVEVDNKAIREFITEGRKKEFELSEEEEKINIVCDIRLVEETGEQELIIQRNGIVDNNEVVATLKLRGVHLSIK